MNRSPESSIHYTTKMAQRRAKERNGRKRQGE
jgi:hypothetical protein